MRDRSWCRSAIAMAVAFLALSAAAGAQWECPTTVPTTCPDVEDQEELREVPVLAAPEGAKELSTTFDVQMRTFCVSTGNKATPKTRTRPDGKVVNLYTAKPLQLRTYVYTDPKTNKTLCGFPGPTLRVRKAGEDGRGGQGIAILLKNNLPAASVKDCADPCPSGITPCDCNDKEKLKALVTTCSVPQPAPKECCCLIKCTQETPNCFHGSNVTNLHFHGSHASPQEPQDYVLLDLLPGKPPVAGAQDVAHSDHGPYAKVAYGQYQYRVDPFGFTQAEGTHWYHPHKHGSVGQQVANGMAGAMIIDGPFDDWLGKLLGGPEEKIMVLQQLAAGTNLFRQGMANPAVLVNGQVSPSVEVEPGEIQRWRIVNATMSSGAMMKITFDPRLVIRQIAMDGVRFSPVNYICQPLANFNPNTPPAAFPCDPYVKVTSLTLAPGNRADFLVQMPLLESSQDNPPLRIERELIELPNEEGSQRQILHDMDEAVAPGIAEPALFHVEVDDGIEGNDAQPKVLQAGAPKMPEKLDLAMPPHHAVLEQVDQTVTMTFEQTAAVTGQPWPYSGSPIAEFKIDGRQFDGDCVNVTTKVGTLAEWTVSNATQITHPFHIHTNPFQLTDYNGAKLPPTGSSRPEPIWMDTFALPLATLVPISCTDVNQCPDSVACTLDPAKPDYGKRCTLKKASMTFRQRYVQFTGEYVLHCHFLGHEDRGMMFAVQTVCKDKPDFFAEGGVDAQCKGPLIKKVKSCT